MELYQLVLKGYYLNFNDNAEFRDANVFRSKCEITDSYVNKIKDGLLCNDNLYAWVEDER